MSGGCLEISEPSTVVGLQNLSRDPDSFFLVVFFFNIRDLVLHEKIHVAILEELYQATIMIPLLSVQ